MANPRVWQRGWLRGLLLALLAGAALLGARLLRGPEVAAYRVARGAVVERVVATGQVLPPARVTLAPLQLARVAEVRVREGDRVRAGDLLVQLDEEEARAGEEAAAAGVALARARLDQVQATGAAVAGEAVRQARVRVAQAEERLGRAEALAAGGSIALQELEEARRAVELARSQEQGAVAQAAATAGAGGELRAAAAQLAQARAQQALAAVRRAQARVRAPADGLVLARACEPGDVVPAGRALLVLAADGETRLTAQPDEKALALLRPGQAARATADAFPAEPFDAEVAYLSPAVDPARGTVEVRLRVARPPPFLRPDMTVSVNVEVARREAVLHLPADAVRGPPDDPFVLLLAGGRAERRPVRVGARGQGVVEVREGLAEGDAVAAGAAAARAGQRARPALLPFPAEGGRAL